MNNLPKVVTQQCCCQNLNSHTSDDLAIIPLRYTFSCIHFQYYYINKKIMNYTRYLWQACTSRGWPGCYAQYGEQRTQYSGKTNIYMSRRLSVIFYSLSLVYWCSHRRLCLEPGQVESWEDTLQASSIMIQYTLELLRSKCIPVLIYGLECFSLPKSDFTSSSAIAERPRCRVGQ